MKTKHIIYISLLIVSNIITYFVTSRDYVICADGELWSYNVKDALAGERQIASACFDLLHRFYSNDDNEFWFDVVVPSEQYNKLDSILNGDWEDFYYYSEEPFSYDSISYTLYE